MEVKASHARHAVEALFARQSTPPGLVPAVGARGGEWRRRPWTRHRLRDKEQNRTFPSTPRLTRTTSGPYDVAALVPSQVQDHAETMEMLWRPDGDQMEVTAIPVVVAGDYRETAGLAVTGRGPGTRGMIRPNPPGHGPTLRPTAPAAVTSNAACRSAARKAPRRGRERPAARYDGDLEFTLAVSPHLAAGPWHFRGVPGWGGTAQPRPASPASPSREHHSKQVASILSRRARSLGLTMALGQHPAS
jgi:hypothetical protein